MLHERTTDDLGKVLFVKTGEHTSVIYGTHYPNRLFVGCLPPEAGAEDLGCFFSTFGNVVEAKVVLDNQGRSKRFGFVTFSNEKDVESTLCCGKEIFFKGKKINVGPAVKKNLDSETVGAKVVPKPPVKTPPISMAVPPTPQHLPKTVIRRSPTESLQIPYDTPSHQDDDTFRSIWGITSKSSSIWAPLSEENHKSGFISHEKSFSNNLLPTQEKSFSLFNWMQENNNHSYDGQPLPVQHHPVAASTNPYNNSLRAPPGFNQHQIHAHQHNQPQSHHASHFHSLMYGQ